MQDEVQMMFDRERGQFWVNNILNLKAKNLLLCGEERAFDAVQDLLKMRGEVIEHSQFERRSTLTVEETKFTELQVNLLTRTRIALYCLIPNL